MGAGWIAQGADTPAPTGADAPKDPWTPVGPDTSSTPALVRPHQDPTAHPVDNSRGLLTQGKQLLFGHEPESSKDPDQHYQAGILPSIGDSVDNSVSRLLAPGPEMSTLARAYPHLVGAQVEKVKAGYQESYGAGQVQSAERQLAALNVLPQVAARSADNSGIVPPEELAKDPLVEKTARSLGISPQEFAGDWAQYAGMSQEAQADAAARAKDTLEKGRANVVSGRGSRNQAWADERVWQPSDVKNGKLDPWSLKGIAFNTALAIPDLAIVAGATAVGTAVGTPGLGVAAGAGAAVALFAPAQRADAKDKIDDQVNRLLEKADQLDDAAPIGGKRGLNPVTEHIRQQAADLAANSDKIADTAGFLYAVSDAVGAVPVASVLARSPAGKAMLDRMVGAAVAKTVGGRVAGSMVANGAGGMLQASIQKAVDAGIVHENTPLAEALKDIAYTGIVSATTALPIAAAHEAITAPGRARVRRELESDELLQRVKSASDAMGAEPKPAAGQEYPGYQWNDATHRYEPTETNAAGSETRPRIAATKGQVDATKAPEPETAPSGAAGARAAYQDKVTALNTAAAAAEKRSDVSLEPQEEGWSVHVKGEAIAHFDTVEAAREAMAGARKLVGTKPAAPANETIGQKPTTFKDIPEAGESAPKDSLEDTQPIERRTATELRQRVTDMNPDQMKAALLTHELTGIPNRRAYEDSPKKAAQASVDVDSLKWLNDNASHDGGDQLLKTVAKALHEESGGNAYHISGDEFVVQGDSHEETEVAMARAKERLAGATLTFAHPDGRTIELKGVGLSHGTGTTLDEAERNLGTAKSSRQAEGLRAGRGEQPPNARITPREAGLQAGGSEAATQKEDLAPNGKARIKSRTTWHGLPIGIENPPGSYRSFKLPNGDTGKRKMRVPYGEFTKTEGADGDSVDVFLGGDSDKAHVIDQLDPTGKKFDEHKVVLGAKDADEAKQLYLDHYQKGWKGFGGITELDPNQLKRWLKEGDLAKPIDPESVPRAKVVRGMAPDARHDSVLQFLARHPRGLDSEEAASQGIDTADMGSSAAFVGIKRAFRKGGMSFDHAAEALHEAGYPVTDAEGHYSPNVLLDRISDELRGRKHFAVHNESHLPEHGPDWRTPLSDAELAKLSVAQAQSRLEALRREQERLEREIERAGLTEEAGEQSDYLDRIPFQRNERHPGVQQDLFSQANQVKSEIKKLEAVLDKKRSSGQESVETGRPDDLFSQARQQTDLTERTRPTTLFRGTETGQGGVKRESSGGEIGRAIYATPHRWLAESYGGGPKARPGAGRDVHQITLPELPRSQYGYIEGGSKQGEKARLVDHTGKVLHEYEGALMSGAAERDAIRGIAEKAGIRVIVGEKESIAENQVAILDPKLITHKTLTTPAAGGALEDAGEKIGGARKDRWAERGMRLSDLSDMTETEAAGLVNKKAVWNPKWEALVGAGMPKDVAGLAKVLIDQLGAKPRNNTPQGRRDYVQAMGLVRDFIEKAKTAAELQGLEGHLVRTLGVPTGYAIASTPEQMRARDIFWSIQKGRRSSLRVAHSDLRKVRMMIEAGWPAKAAPVATETDDAKPKEDKAGPKRPHLDRIERIGPPVRKGNVTSSDFIKDFGFRGLEFGNWAASDERQGLLNHAYEGLHDLARAMGLPPQALALNGTMGLALGARGGGRFAAHYEPGKLVINMTKINGAGALAHEWGHALDHYLGELGRADAYTTDARGASGWYKDPGSRTLAHLRPEMQQAFGDVNKAMFKKTIGAAEYIRDTELSLERAKAQKREIEEAIKERPDDTNLPHRLDWVNGRIETAEASRARALADPEGTFGERRTKYANDAAQLGEYWRRPTEMFARAFEAFIFDKLKAAGQQSDYLVHGNEAALYEGNPKGNPYPAEDRPAINAAMQKLADTLEVHGEKHAIREMDLPSAGADTTHYAVREPPPSAKAPKDLRSGAGVRQLDIFANAAAPAPATQAARLAQSVKLAHIGEFRSGINQVKTWQDAAHILAPLRKNPQENMVALVVDKAGKPLAVIRHTIGVSDGASVEPWSLAGSVAQVPGASSVYFAHNHPSGVVSQSHADERMTTVLHNLLEGSGILPRGMIVVSPNSRTASYFLPESGAGDYQANIPAARRSGMVPMQERRYARLSGDLGNLHGQTFKGGPEAAKKAIIASGEKSGVMLANKRHEVVGIVPMSRQEMSRLRTGDPAHGAARLLKALAEGNANTMVVFGARPAALNVAIFGNSAGARVIDVMHWDGDELRSAAQGNNMPDTGHENFLKRGDGASAGSRMAPAEVRTQVDALLKGFSVKPDVVIAKNLSELQADPAFSFDLAPYQDGDVTAFVHPPTGKIYLIADQFHGPSDVASAFAHEYITHFGLRAAFGDARNPEYQAILDGVARAMPTEMRERGEREFGNFNPMNAKHRNVAAEETLAYYGQRYAQDQSIPAQIKRWLDKLHAMIRDWIRSVIGLPQKFDELFVKRTLADLESFLRRRSAPGQATGAETRPAFAGKQDTFFSGLARAVDAAKRDKGTGAEWEATLRNMPGVKAEEMQWTGLKDWLEGRGRVSKDEVAEYVNAHRVQIGEVEHGAPARLTAAEGIRTWLVNNGDADNISDEDMEELSNDVDWALGGDREAAARLEEHGVPPAMLAPMPSVDERNNAIVDQINALGYHVEASEMDGSPILEEIHTPGEDLTEEQYQRNYEEAKRLLDTLDNNGSNSPVKYGDWATPGGTNYRELLLTLPENKELVAARDAAIDKIRAHSVAETDARAYTKLFAELVARAPANASHVEQAFVNTIRDHGMLGFDNLREATRAILDHKDWAERWGIDDPDAVKAIEKGRAYRLQKVEANSLTDLLATAAVPNSAGAIDARLKLSAKVAVLSPAFRAAALENMEKAIKAYRRAYDLSDKINEARRIASEGAGYHSGHWDEQNVLAHIRFDERSGPNGERILHIHELQSDWHQAGRRSGYMTKQPPSTLPSNPTAEDVRRYHDISEEAWNGMTQDERNIHWNEAAHDAIPKLGGVPDAPFKTTWPELAIKRMLRYAAERGYDALSWDTGDTNAERYNMQKVADHIRVYLASKARDTYRLVASKGGRIVTEGDEFSPEKLAQYIGKDMAQKAISHLQDESHDYADFKGDDLKVGGAGMRGFYDDILPKTVQKMVKKWGSSVEPGSVVGTLAHNGTRSVVDEHGGVGFTSEHEQLPAHTVRITPAMRDSVMAGQPMFLKRRKGSAGAPPPAPKKGAYDLARRAVAAIPNNEFALSLRRIADPAGVSESSKATAVVTREALGELAQASEEALKNLEQYSKQFDLLSIPDRYAFIDAMEGGKPTAPELQPAADAIRDLLDGWRENIRGLGVGALDNFIENYFPHIWQRDDRAKKIFGQIFGRRPLKGPASFLKERTIPTTREGLDAGLQPISSNPLILAFAKLREMQRFYTGVKLMQRFKDEGLAKFLPAHKLRPDDWAEINDAVGRVRQWSEVEQGFIERGKYIMPVDAARVINNHLSASALRNFLPAQIFRVLSNAANALQLGFSAFHLGFTTLDAIISKNALAIEQLLHGEPVRAVGSLMEGLLGGPLWNIRRGGQLLKAYSNISGATPQMRRIVEGLMAAGGRVKMDNYYMAARGLSPFKGVGFATLASDVKAALTQPYGKVQAATQVLTSFPQQYAMRLWRDLTEVWRLEPLKILPIMSALEVAGRMTRASTSIIMEHIVPLQKLGVFSDLAADHIRRNPFEDPVAFADAMQKIWNSVDNRLGEMVYDNVFWNRTFKEVNHMLVRAVGWNLGTVRELGGAPIDVVKVLDYLARGAPAEASHSPLGKGQSARQGYEEAKSKFQRIAEKVGHKIPYTLALIATTMILGAALTYLFTGKGPEETKDYFFPRTGRKTKYGTPERVSMPSYTKDLYEYATQPMTTVINKANPIFGIAHSIYANEDFFGNAVRNPDAGFWQQLLEGAQYAGRQVQPFSLQGTKQFVGAGEMDARGKVLSTMPYIGFGPAPARVTSPEQMDRYQMREKEKSYIRGLQRRLKVATEKGDKEAIEQLRSEIAESKVKERGTERDIRQDKIKAQEAAKKISSLIKGRSREEAADAIAQAGMPAFAQLWRTLPDNPKTRVAQSLDAFAV